MSNPEQPFPQPDVKTVPQLKEVVLPLLAPDQLAGYKEWKGSVPSEIRALVEGNIMGKQVRIDKDGLPSVVEFLSAMRQTLQDLYEQVSPTHVKPLLCNRIFLRTH